MEGLIPVTHDLYSVAERLKEIDERYELYYNARLGRYEIHASGVLQMAVPEKVPDARTIARVRETRVERAADVMREIERANAAARIAAERAALDKAEALLDKKEILCL